MTPRVDTIEERRGRWYWRITTTGTNGIITYTGCAPYTSEERARMAAARQLDALTTQTRSNRPRP